MKINDMILVDGTWYCVDEVMCEDDGETYILATNDEGQLFDFNLDDVEQVR